MVLPLDSARCDRAGALRAMLLRPARAKASGFRFAPRIDRSPAVILRALIREGANAARARAGRASAPKPTGAAPARRARRARAARPRALPSTPRRRARAPRSTAMRLAAEVERLERELAAARAQMAELAARAEIDPLTDILNRRGFERELKRSLAYVKRYGTERRADLCRSRRLQARQRPPRPRRRRRVLKAVAMVLDPPRARLRRGGAARRRRVRRAAVEPAPRRTRRPRRAALEGGDRAHHRDPCGRDALGRRLGGRDAAACRSIRPAEVLERADRAMYARKAARSAAGCA